MMAQKLRFSRGLKAKVPGAGAVTARVPAPTPLVEIFTGPAPIDWTQEATMVKVRIYLFFYLRGSFKCMIVILPTFWRSTPALKFSWQLARYVSLATMLVHPYQRSPRRRRVFTGEHRGLRSQQFCERCGYCFFTRCPRHQFPLPANLHRHSRHTHFQQDEISSLLDRRPGHGSHQNVPIVPACVASGNIHNAVSRHLDKNRAKHRRTVFSMNKAKRASSDQRTDEKDSSETCNNNHVGGRTMTKAKKQNWGRTYIYVLGHRDGRFGDVCIRPVAVNGLKSLPLLFFFSLTLGRALWGKGVM